MNIFAEFTTTQLLAALARAWSTASRDEIERELVARRVSPDDIEQNRLLDSMLSQQS